MSEFVGVEAIEPEAGHLVYKAAILCAYTKVLHDVEIGTATIDESTPRLPVRSAHDELLSWIEYQRAAAAQHVRSDVSYLDGQMCNQCTCHFVKICLDR